MAPKVLFYDLETFPNVAYVWGKYEQNVIAYVEEGHLLSFSAKWLGGRHITRGLCDYKDKTDKSLVLDLHKLFSEADILVAHNGDRFDIRKANERFLHYGLPPPAPYKTLDTKKIAKRVSDNNSNSLDDLCQKWGLGRKVKHAGFELWLGCKNGDKKSWTLMKKYNKHDVILLERLYKYLLAWIPNHPHFVDGLKDCPNFSSTNLQRRGQGMNRLGKYQRVQCMNCGTWSKQLI